MSCCAVPAAEIIRESNQETARLDLLRELKADARHLANGATNYQIALPAMHCGNCIATIERELSPMPGIEKVRANLTLKQVSITLLPGNDHLQPVLSKLAVLGFAPQSLSAIARAGKDEILNGLLRAMAVAGFAAANIMLLSVPVWTGAAGTTETLFHYLSAMIAVPAVAYSGRPFFDSAMQALRHRHVNMDVPISLGVILATLMSLYESFIGGGHAYFDAAVSLLFFLLIGRVLDHMMRSKARAAASRLAQLASKGGMVVDASGHLTYLALDGIRPGMRLRIAVGERFPVDGTVVEGDSDVDRGLVTGESAAIAIAVGSGVEAGTVNLTGAVDIAVTRAAENSFLAEINRMMVAAENGRSAYIQLSDRMARAYAPVVHVLAACTFIGWMMWSHGSIHASLTAAISVLIITCPCALGLAVPVAHVVSAGRLFANGILMKDGSALERMASIDEVAFDKTGTLTTSEPAIKMMGIPLGEPADVAKALASRSIHPAAKALSKALTTITTASVSDVHELPGRGIEARAYGRLARLGRANWVAEIARGKTQVPDEAGVAFAQEGGPIYYCSFSETLRSGAQSLVSELKRRKIKSFIISGDGTAQVAHIAQMVGISETHAGLKPSDKLSLLQLEAAAGHRMLMVGDGLNDAPALAASYVSMAPSSASDVGRMAADFVFTRDDLSAVAFAHRTAVNTARIVRQNFGLAILYNIVAVPLAMSGQLNPLIAAVAMSTSSILVVANSLRLQLFRNRESGT